MTTEGDCFSLRGFQIYDTSLNANQWMDKGVNINFLYINLQKLYHFEEIKVIDIYSCVSGSFCVFLLLNNIK